MNQLLIQEKTSETLINFITETSINNNKGKEDINEKVLELMTDKGMIAPYLASSLVNLCKPENNSQFGLKKTLIQLRWMIFWYMEINQ